VVGPRRPRKKPLGSPARLDWKKEIEEQSIQLLKETEGGRAPKGSPISAGATESMLSRRSTFGKSNKKKFGRHGRW